ncbi:hypothetical protein ACTMU2_13930 [Cupriavidus basilensis]
MRVYLTEKPDVAKHVAEFFGYERRESGAYWLKNGDAVTWMIGDMFDQGKPEDYARRVSEALRGFAQLRRYSRGPLRTFPTRRSATSCDTSLP